MRPARWRLRTWRRHLVAEAGRAPAVWLMWPRKEYIQHGLHRGPHESPNEAWGHTPLVPQLPDGLFYVSCPSWTDPNLAWTSPSRRHPDHSHPRHPETPTPKCNAPAPAAWAFGPLCSAVSSRAGEGKGCPRSLVPAWGPGR